jgi:hypothetical protein
MAAEISLDAPPPARKIRVIIGQTYDRVQMIRQDHDGVDRKWPFLPGCAKRRAKNADMVDKRG